MSRLVSSGDLLSLRESFHGLASPPFFGLTFSLFPGERFQNGLSFHPDRARSLELFTRAAVTFHLVANLSRDDFCPEDGAGWRREVVLLGREAEEDSMILSVLLFLHGHLFLRLFCGGFLRVSLSRGGYRPYHI